MKKKIKKVKALQRDQKQYTPSRRQAMEIDCSNNCSPALNTGDRQESHRCVSVCVCGFSKGKSRWE